MNNRVRTRMRYLGVCRAIERRYIAYYIIPACISTYKMFPGSEGIMYERFGKKGEVLVYSAINNKMRTFDNISKTWDIDGFKLSMMRKIKEGR